MLFARRAQRELPEAERDLQAAKMNLEHLESLLNEGKLVGIHTHRLFHTLKQTFALQAHYVETLKREISEGM